MLLYGYNSIIVLCFKPVNLQLFKLPCVYRNNILFNENINSYLKNKTPILFELPSYLEPEKINVTY